jgi:hypothetical protein
MIFMYSLWNGIFFHSVIMIKVAIIHMHVNLTNVGLSIFVCYSLFGFISESDDWMRAIPGLHIPLKELTWMERKVCDTLARWEKFIIILAWREGSKKITALWAKVGIMLMLDNPTWQEKFCQRTYPACREKGIMTHVLIVYPTLGNSFLE